MLIKAPVAAVTGAFLWLVGRLIRRLLIFSKQTLIFSLKKGLYSITTICFTVI
jgi:hypothetical protein